MQAAFVVILFLFLTNDLKIGSLNLTLKAIAKSDSGTYVSLIRTGFGNSVYGLIMNFRKT